MARGNYGRKANYAPASTVPQRVAPPPQPPVPSIQQAPQPSFLRSAATVATGVAAGHVMGNALSSLGGSAHCSSGQGQPAEAPPRVPSELQVQDNFELSWLRCLRENKTDYQLESSLSEHPAIDCVKKLVVNRM